ncbi:MAG: hypothetical protein M1815_001816 [Lichina confinis]|nr:MAG: hypothetical protein M1815_001816 [Lichina confinis]
MDVTPAERNRDTRPDLVKSTAGQRPKTTATPDLCSYAPFTATAAVVHDDLDASSVRREPRLREDASPAVSS